MPETTRKTKAQIEASPERPEALRVEADNIPAELRKRQQWVLWKYVWKPEKKRKDGGKGDWDKPLFDVHTGKHASSTNPDTWATFEEVLAAYEAGGWDGVGFIPTPDDGLVVIDLDGCRDKKAAAVEPWAQKIVDEMKTYTE